MNYFYIFIFIIFFVIINSKKNIKESEAWVIERKGRFYKIITKNDKNVVIIPFVDKIVEKVDLNINEITFFAPCILIDGNLLKLKYSFSYKVKDVYKLVYECNDKLEIELKKSFNSVLIKFFENFYLDEAEFYIKNTDKIKERFNQEISKFGCEIISLKLKIMDTNFSDNSFNDIFYIKNSKVISNYTNLDSIYDSKSKNTYFVIIFLFILYAILSFTYKKTNNLLFYFGLSFYLEILPFFIINYLIFYLIIDNNIKKWLYSILVSISILILFQNSIISNNFSVNYKKINNKIISKLSYNIEIIIDILNKETKKIKINSENLKTYNKKIFKVTRYYIMYEVNDKDINYIFSSEYDTKIINIIEKLKNCEAKIEIEYYPNSGIIKSIDGIEKFNYELLNERINYLKQKERTEALIEVQIKSDLEKKKKEKEDEEKKKEYNKYLEKSKLKDEAIKNSIYKNIEEVKEEFDKLEIDYSIEYISSKKFKVNTIVYNVLFDEDSYIRLFVVKDNKKEDMIEFPKLEIGMTKDEVSKILDSVGIEYEFYEDTYSSSGNENVAGTLAIIPIKEAELYPKVKKLKLKCFNGKSIDEFLKSY